jgi:rubrerythrin
MGPIEALELARKVEVQSIEMYRRFIIEHPAARDVFQFLLDEEEKHQQIIDKKITELKK